MEMLIILNVQLTIKINKQNYSENHKHLSV